VVADQKDEDDVYKELDENVIINPTKDPEQISRKNSDEPQEGEEENKEEVNKPDENLDLGGQFKQYLKVNDFIE